MTEGLVVNPAGATAGDETFQESIQTTGESDMSSSVTKETTITNTGEVDDVDGDYFAVGGFVRSWSDGGEEPIVTVGPLHVFAGEVNELVSTICKAKAGVTTLARNLSNDTSPSASFVREEAEFITNDGETLTIAAQFHNNGDGTFDRLVLINDYAIRCDSVDDLIIALGEARDRGLAA